MTIYYIVRNPIQELLQYYYISAKCYNITVRYSRVSAKYQSYSPILIPSKMAHTH